METTHATIYTDNYKGSNETAMHGWL